MELDATRPPQISQIHGSPGKSPESPARPYNASGNSGRAVPTPCPLESSDSLGSWFWTHWRRPKPWTLWVAWAEHLDIGKPRVLIKISQSGSFMIGFHPQGTHIAHVATTGRMVGTPVWNVSSSSAPISSVPFRKQQAAMTKGDAVPSANLMY